MRPLLLAIVCTGPTLQGCEGGPYHEVADASADADVDTDADSDTDTESETETETLSETDTETSTGPACDEAADCDDLEACTDDSCSDGRCMRAPVTAGDDQGLCDECDGAGGHRPPVDDSACAVIDCGEDSHAISLADPNECLLVHRDPIDDARCDAVGLCKTVADCDAVPEVVDTLVMCERFVPGTCAGAAGPAVENAPAGTRTEGCSSASCDGNQAVEAGCDGAGGCTAEFSRVDCTVLTCVADAEGARCE